MSPHTMLHVETPQNTSAHVVLNVSPDLVVCWHTCVRGEDPTRSLAWGQVPCVHPTDVGSGNGPTPRVLLVPPTPALC